MGKVFGGLGVKDRMGQEIQRHLPKYPELFRCSQSGNPYPKNLKTPPLLPII